jgi:HEAT repeat protein
MDWGLERDLEAAMLIAKNNSVRHVTEAVLLKQALEGNPNAANNVVQYISSPDPHLRQIMQETIHDTPDATLWRHLLCCLAVQRWGDRRDCDLRSDPEASQRIDQSIIEVFAEDEGNLEKSIKETVLHEALQDSDLQIRQAAACLLGMRGDSQIIPRLVEILDIGKKGWKIRAIRALGEIKDERSGLPLIQAMTLDDGILRSEARRALQKLGPLAEPAWLAALDQSDKHIRWLAARGSGDASGIRSIEILAEGLLDDDHEVRWTTADLLARIGERSVPATLRVLSCNEVTGPFRQAAYHALHGVPSLQVREHLKPLLDALQSAVACAEAPAIAQRLLAEWESVH